MVAESLIAPANALTFTAPTLPTWLTLIDHGDGTVSLSGTPGSGDVGDHPIVMEVTDGFATGTQSFTITVLLSNNNSSNNKYYLPLIMKGFASGG